MRSIMSVSLSLAVASVCGVAACATQLQAQDAADVGPTVPFHMPQTDATDTPTSMAWMNDGPAEARVTVEGAHLYADGERTKFWGVNICGDAAFPDKERAEAFAGHLAKLGINSVRLHHLDNNWQSRNIFGPMPNATTRRLDPEMLDRLDFFIAALKKHGIYSNVNVLCSRKHVEGDGVPQDVLDTPWKLTHTLAFVDPQLRDLHKETAKQILKHVNPYTGMTYAEDPAVAIVEVTNENGLIQPFFEGKFHQMPERHQQMLTTKWNDWLAEKYGTAEAITAAWPSQSEPLGDSFIAPVSEEHYNAIAQMGAEADLTVDDDVLTYEVTKSGGAAWTGEITTTGIALEKGKLYTASFTARSDDYAGMKVNLSKNGEPWTPLGMDTYVSLTPEPTTHTFSFIAADNTEDARYLFSGLGGQTGKVMLTDVTLRPGGTVSMPDNLDLTPGEIPMVGFGPMSSPVPAAATDFMRFLADAEHDYWSDMVAYFRDDLGVKGLIVPTIVGYTAPLVMDDYDVIDTHHYWALPVGEPWTENWSANPDSMLTSNRANAITAPATKRVVGKPFFLSEYNHCNPNPHAAEGPLMLAAYASLQDWDGIWWFSYFGDEGDWDSEFISSPFNSGNHPTLMANFAAAGLIFRQNHLRPAELWVTRRLDEDTQAELLASVGTPWNNVNLSDLGVSQTTAMRHRVGLVLPGDDEPANQALPVSEDAEEVFADTGQIIWDSGPEDSGKFTVATSGTLVHVGRGSTDIGSFRWTPARDDWHTFTAVRLPNREEDAQTVQQSLVIVTGEVRNTDMGYNDDQSSVGLKWGKAPTLVRPVHGELRSRNNGKPLKVFALDTTGAKQREIDFTQDGDFAVIDLDADTLWYLLELR
ncbi:MAG: hypothetical protein AAGK78_00215 [Planctomycetota bacterium]